MRLLLRNLIAFTIVLTGISPVWAGCPSRTYTYTTGQTIDPSQVTTNEDSLFTYACAVDTLADGAVVTADLADSAVTSAKINDGTIVNADVSSSAAITYSKLSFSNNIVAGDIASGAVDAGDMATTGTIADDKVFVADSATAGTWRTLPNCTDSGGNHLNYTQSSNTFSCGTTSTSGNFAEGTFTRDTATASGTQSVTTTFQPSIIGVACAQSGSKEASLWGVSTGDSAEANLNDNNASSADTYAMSTSSIIYIDESAGNGYQGDITATSSTSFTITWTRTGAPTGTLTCAYWIAK